ncbi:uncharacterized protein BX664DRAFT_333541 [Halteromyces radiatus]|uniref:uncharacterized protein n=1 Tax=Halteromyces radiatus TaxID=101107 RepID=UPI00221FF595|nr:uncharacterized protein BX664DRAFT_333541 [Halteromyces radiatus]KAI8089641.1 hypothetical protein BX664DRAFT_333541 [Halteromyces radiatus]
MDHFDSSYDAHESDGWRDPTILPDANSLRRSGNIVNRHETEVTAPSRQPDDCWMLPSTSTEVDILGPQNKQLEIIQKKTEAYLVFNRAKHQVDIWGDHVSIPLARQYLDHLGDQHHEKKQPTRKTKKWGKPERQLTEKEQRREEKRQQRQMEERSYQGLPAGPQPYIAFFPLPDNNLPLEKFVGEKESFLNKLRASGKSHIWYEESMNAFKVAGQDQDLVQETATRLRQWYLKQCRRLMPAELRLLYQPTKNIGARFIKLPASFTPCELYLRQTEFDSYRMLDPLVTGAIKDTLHKKTNALVNRPKESLDLIQLGNEENYEGSIEDNDEYQTTGGDGDSSVVSKSLLDLNERNAKLISVKLDEGLESLRLLDWDISLDVIFGQIYLVSYPKKTDMYVFSAEELADKYFPHDKFESKLAPCIGTSHEHVKGLLEYLSRHGEEYADSPRTSFTVEAIQMPTLPEAPKEGFSRGDRATAPDSGTIKPGLSWRTMVKVNGFTKDGYVRLWDCVTDYKSLVKISCANLEGEYSWETRLKYARRLPSELNTPHGQFVDKMRLTNTNRLSMMMVPGYQPHIIKQITTWVYGWGSYVVEVEKEEMWDMANMDDIHTSKLTTSGLPLDLSKFTPHRVNYHISMYKERWRNRFSDNLNLDIGEAPSWTPRHFLNNPGTANMNDQEDAKTIQEDAKKFADMLSSVLPRYFENRPVSLV